MAPLLPGKVSDAEAADRLNRLRMVFTELKVDKFRKATTFLEDGKRSEILRLIEVAEAIKIDETPNLSSGNDTPCLTIR